MTRLSNNHIKKIFYFFIVLSTIVIFSLCNIFTLIMTCGNHYCYYKKCNKYNFGNKIECFFDKTDDIFDWLMLDLFMITIITVVFMIIIFCKIIYKKIKKWYNNYKYNQYVNKNYEIGQDNILSVLPEEEELETEERDPLLNV